MPSTRGWIFDIQRFSIHDGPGIRTTVFMKGCPLRCVWCHNPEGLRPAPDLSFMSERCIGCGYCFRACRQGGHVMEDGKHVLRREVCRVCGTCAEECYAAAIELIGREASVEEALDEVLRDRPFYETSGGGMTLSGGEPMMQPEFTAALLGAAKERGLHCCIETCGFADFHRFERVMPLVDLFLYDIKELDPARHREFTGVPNALIIENLRRLHERGARTRVRLPIIPGYNDREDHLAAVAALCRSLPRLEGVEVMPYHRLGTSKVARLGLDPDEREKSAAPDTATVAAWNATLERLGVRMIAG